MKFQSALFIVLMFLLVLLFAQQKSMHHPPRSVHQWRQSDAYSMTLNYYHDGLGLFSPALHLQVSKDGKAAGEFPVVYYLSALIWKITGPSVFVVRAINLLIAFCGLFALFRLTYGILKDLFFSLLIPVLIYASPVFAYYSNSFLVNVDALSFLFMGWYFLYCYHRNKSTVSLILAVLLVSLAGLLRTTMLIGYIPVAGWMFLQLLRDLRQDSLKTSFRIFMLGLPFALIAAWMLFISNYNAQNGSVYFLTTIRPIWDMPDPGRIWEVLVTKQLLEVYPMSFLVALLAVILLALTTLRKQNSLLHGFILFIALELVAYLLLWYANLDVHDYYLIELLIIVPPVMILALMFLRKHGRIFSAVYFRGLITCLIAILVLYSAVKTRLKYDPEILPLTSLLLSEKEIAYYDWHHWEYGMKLQAFETVEPYLKEIGIDRSKKVISIPDPSSNISLSLMDRKGFTTLYLQNDKVRSAIPGFQKEGAQYLMIFDSTFAAMLQLDTFMRNPVGRYRNISIYKL